MKKQMLKFDEIKKTVAELGKQYGLESVYLFGSYARDEAKSSSDVDLRINKGKLKGLFALSMLKLNLEESFGRKVDLVTTDSLDSDFLTRIAPEEILLYAN